MQLSKVVCRKNYSVNKAMSSWKILSGENVTFYVDYNEPVCAQQPACAEMHSTCHLNKESASLLFSFDLSQLT